MNVDEAYNVWAAQYDSNDNKTRDLEAISLRETLSHIPFSQCLEIGCGTGKNTAWLAAQSKRITAVDFSKEMLAIAQEKVRLEHVHFIQADITEPWSFADKTFDLVTFSLVLEHIEDLESIFEKVHNVLLPGGHVYIGELHPFKQYAGTKARFESDSGRQEVLCFNHNLSEFFKAAKRFGFQIEMVKEYFDDNNSKQIPRILTIVLKN